MVAWYSRTLRASLPKPYRHAQTISYHAVLSTILLHTHSLLLSRVSQPADSHSLPLLLLLLPLLLDCIAPGVQSHPPGTRLSLTAATHLPALSITSPLPTTGSQNHTPITAFTTALTSPHCHSTLHALFATHIAFR